MKKKEAYYFSHDANSRNDLKCVKLRQDLGMEGYGIFWAIIEILRESEGYKLKKSDLRTISYELKVSEDVIFSVVNNYGLFKISNDTISSKRLTQSMFEYNKRKQNFSDAGKRGNAIRWQSGGDRGVIALKESKGKEKKKGNFSPNGVEIQRIVNGIQVDKDGFDHNGNFVREKPGMVW